MGIGKIGLKTVKCLFWNTLRPDAKAYEQIPMGVSLAYTGYNLYDCIDKLNNKKDAEAKDSMLNAYAGMAATLGSVFGAGGAIILGGGIKLLGESTKRSFA